VGSNDVSRTPSANDKSILSLQARPLRSDHDDIRTGEEFHLVYVPSCTPAAESVITVSLTSSTSHEPTPVSSGNGSLLYLERMRRVTLETPTEAPHESCRFGLGLVNVPTQTWTAFEDKDQNSLTGSLILLGARVYGLKIGGASNDAYSAAYHDRRWLTLRTYDEPCVIVRNLHGDERLMFLDALPPSVTPFSSPSLSSV
jgi:hypothetical protein